MSDISAATRSTEFMVLVTEDETKKAFLLDRRLNSQLDQKQNRISFLLDRKIVKINKDKFCHLKIETMEKNYQELLIWALVTYLETPIKITCSVKLFKIWVIKKN